MRHHALQMFLAMLLSACGDGDSSGPCGPEPDSQCVSECANGECGELHTWDCNESTGQWMPREEINECGWPEADGGCSGTGVGCNPVSQNGCCPAYKCAFVLDDPSSGNGRVDCAPDGTKQIGEECTEPLQAEGSDDCAAGGHCYMGLCRQICTSIKDTCTDGACTSSDDQTGNPLPLEWCMPL